MLRVESLNKSFGSFQAVQDLSFEIHPGEVVGFLGPNGAGKSTTMRMITGFLTPDSGQVFVDNQSLHEQEVRLKSKIGYLPESSPLYYNQTVWDFLEFIAQMRGLSKSVFQKQMRYVVENCHLKDVLEKKISQLSKGFKQRVCLAQALLHDPDILVLDEPTVGLDPNQILEIRKLIREIAKNKTVLLSTHIMQEVSAICSRVIIINGGKIIAQGSPQELQSKEHLGATYDVSIRGDWSKIEERLKTLPGFIQSQIQNSEGNLHRVLVSADSENDLSEKIFDLAVENSWKLSQLQKQKHDLEDVFKNLTGGSL